MIGGRILDTSALVQAARGRPYMQALFYISHEHLIMLVIPAPCLADALACLDDPEDQDRLFDLLRSPIAEVAQFGETEARGIGLLRASARASQAGAAARASTGRASTAPASTGPASTGPASTAAVSTAAAHAAFLAANRGWPVVSAAPGPIRALHPEVEIEPLP